MILYYEQDRQIKQIEIPLSTAEISFESFCDFRSAEAAYYRSNADSEPDSSEPARLLIDAIACIVDGDLHGLPFAVDGDVVNDTPSIIDDGHIIGPGEPLSLLRVYAHIVTVINRYQPEQIPDTFVVTRRRFPWLSAERLEIHYEPVARILERRPMTTGEAIELMEYQRIADGRPVNTSADIGNTEFTLGLTEVALLLRQPGERLPSNRRDLDRFIADRRKQFANLPLSVILDLRFFLITACLKLRTTLDSGSFGKAPRGQAARPKLNNKKRVRRRRRKRGR